MKLRNAALFAIPVAVALVLCQRLRSVSWKAGLWSVVHSGHPLGSYPTIPTTPTFLRATERTYWPNVSLVCLILRLPGTGVHCSLAARHASQNLGATLFVHGVPVTSNVGRCIPELRNALGWHGPGQSTANRGRKALRGRLRTLCRPWTPSRARSPWLNWPSCTMSTPTRSWIGRTHCWSTRPAYSALSPSGEE